MLISVVGDKLYRNETILSHFAPKISKFIFLDFLFKYHYLYGFLFQWNNVENWQLLLNYNSNVDDTFANLKTTALMTSCFHGHSEIVKSDHKI